MCIRTAHINLNWDQRMEKDLGLFVGLVTGLEKGSELRRFDSMPGGVIVFAEVFVMEDGHLFTKEAVLVDLVPDFSWEQQKRRRSSC